MQTRRECLAALGAFMARPGGLIIDTHIHLFDPKRFPYHPNAPYRPPEAPMEPYLVFARQAGIRHTVIVHPEPYQDDHRYNEYCLNNNFFKATCLFDPVDPKTPARMASLARKYPGRIVALRIHETRRCGEKPTTSGAIRDRDMSDPAMARTWAAAGKLGMAVQMHLIPCHAPAVGRLAERFPAAVVLDHLARSGQGTPAEYEGVLRLARLPHVYMKFSGVQYSSKQPFPHRDAKPLVRRTFDAFGPRRMLWGGLGHSMPEFERAVTLFEEMFDFASAADRAAIRGLNAAQLYRFVA